MTNMHEECLLTFLAKKTMPNPSALNKLNTIVPAATKPSISLGKQVLTETSNQNDTFEHTPL